MPTATPLKTQGLAGLGMGLVLALAACGGGHDAEEKEKAAARSSAQSVTAAVISGIDLPQAINVSGSVSAWEEVPVGAETGGLTAVGVYVDEGSYVQQGQVLVKLNDTLLQAQLRQQQAGVASAEALNEQQTAALARARDLHGQGFLSQASLDNAIANQRTAQAQLQSARASLAETRARLEQTNLRAPVSGLIISRSVTRGQIVGAGQEIFRMVRDGRLELDANVPERQLPLLRPGMTVVVTSEQAGETSGTIRIVTPEVNPDTRLGIARITINASSGLRPGMFARARIDTGVQPGLSAPAEAIVFREGRPGVYVIGSNSAVTFVPVVTGDRVGDRVVIVSGVTTGQRVVVQGAGFLGEGDRVTVNAPAAPASAPAEQVQPAPATPAQAPAAAQ